MAEATDNRKDSDDDDDKEQSNRPDPLAHKNMERGEPSEATSLNGNSSSRASHPAKAGSLGTTGNNTTPEDLGHNWMHKSSHSLENLLTPLDSGLSTKSKHRNTCAFSMYMSLVESKNFKEALLDE